MTEENDKKLQIFTNEYTTITYFRPSCGACWMDGRELGGYQNPGLHHKGL